MRFRLDDSVNATLALNSISESNGTSVKPTKFTTASSQENNNSKIALTTDFIETESDNMSAVFIN